MRADGPRKKSTWEAPDENGQTPPRKKSRIERRNSNDDAEPPVETPTKPRRGRPPGSGKKQQSLTNGSPANGFQKLSVSKTKPSTPRRSRPPQNGDTNVPIIRNADSSARRKSAKNMLDRMAANETSEGSDIEDMGDDDDILARKIWEEADEEAGSSDQAEEESIEEDEDASAVAARTRTPSKRKPRGAQRRKKSKSPTPPIDLPAHEQFFWQNRPGRVKTSNNTLSSLSLLSHEHYYKQMSVYEDPHTSSHQYLHSIHKRSFPQWRFELSQAFNICLYGYGSKRTLVTDFAHYLHRCHSPDGDDDDQPPKIFIVNGYDPSLTLRNLLTNLAPIVYDCPAAALPKLPTQPRDLLASLLTQLDSTSSPSSPTSTENDTSQIHIFINSLDAAPLRRGTTPTLLAQLAAHRRISLLASCDTPNFPLLWDVPTRDRYNFLFHDATTFISYASINVSDESTTAGGDSAAEVPDVIDTVNDLLGRSGRTIKGKEGVGFVLRSLPENARNLYRILISEILAGMDMDMELDAGDDDDDDSEEARTATTTSMKRRREGGNGNGNNGRNAGPTTTMIGIDYKILYQKTVEEFICSNEMGFRTLLKEFWDHDMIVSVNSNNNNHTSKRDRSAAAAGGAEVLGVPWRREEMEAILEDLLS